MKEEKYIFSIGQETLEGRDLLNKFFNPTTKTFLLANGLKEGMNVLELGCGVGFMTRWIAEQVGKNASVTGVDVDKNQIAAANEKAR